MTGREIIEAILRQKDIDKEVIIEDLRGNDSRKNISIFEAEDGIIIQTR